jgi:hypothetical protein
LQHESIADVNNDGADTYHPMVQLLEPISYAEYVNVTEDQVIMRDYDCDQQKYTVTMSSIPTEPWYILLGSKDMIEVGMAHHLKIMHRLLLIQILI